MWIKALDFLLGSKSRLALLGALGALALALWLVWGENRSLGREALAARAANAAQAASLKALVADKEALNRALREREAELEKIRTDFGAKMARLGALERSDPELAAWGARILPAGLDGLRRGADGDAHRGNQADPAGGVAARLP